jgi:hypothetical protein
VFLEKAGFRFSGALLDALQSEVELIATRSDESMEPLKTTMTRVPADEQIALARRLIEPYLKSAIESGADIDKNWAISSLARFDAIAALEVIDRTTWGDGMKQRTRDWVIELMIDGLSPGRLDDAVPYIEASEAAESAATAYIQLTRAVPVEDRARRLDYVRHALVHARNSKEPERLVFVAQVAEHLHELGEEDHARRLAEEVYQVAERSSDQVLGWTLGVFPLALARIDLPRSLALLDRLSDGDYAYRMGMLALRLADRDPAAAERVWNLPTKRMSESTDFLIRRDNRRAARVCFHMARADQERARRIAAGVTELIWKTYGLGAIAYSLSESDPSAARQFLVDVFAGSGPQEHPLYTTPNRKAIAVAWLLPVAERVDAQLGREYFWRALSLRSPRPGVEELDDKVEYWDAELAKMVARYDAKIARAMLEPLVQRVQWAVALSGEAPLDMQSVLEAAAIVDPHWAVGIVEGLPEPPDASVARPKNSARVTVAPILGLPGKWDWHMNSFWHPAYPKYY